MNWYIIESGVKSGPFPEEEIRSRIEARAISTETVLWQEGAADGQPAASMACFQSSFAVGAAPPRMSPGSSSLRPLTLEDLRDKGEKTALAWLWIFSIPAWLLLILWVVAGFGFPLVFVGIFWLAGRIAQLFFAADIRTNGIRVWERQLPEVHRAVLTCAERLQIAPPEVYVVQHSIWNAFAAKLAGRRVVVLYSGAIDSVLLKGDMDQLMWLVGHEIGHHAAGHLDWSRTLARLGAWAPWVHLWHSRRCEFTSDRIGLYCVGKLKPAMLAMANMTVGAQFADRINPAAAAADWEACRKEFFVKYRTMYSTHPANTWRMQQLAAAAREFGIDEGAAG